MSERLDELRLKFPLLGFAVYAMEPGKGVTLEVYAPDGQVFSFRGPTVAAAIERAFPPAELAAEEPFEEPPAPQVDLFS